MARTATPLRQVVGAGLKEIRQAQGLSQDEAAARVREHGLTTWIRGTVAQAEVGARRIPLEEVLLLALAFKVVPADFIVGEPDDLIELTTGACLSVGAVRALLSGDAKALRKLPDDAVRVAESAHADRIADLLLDARRAGLNDPAMVERAVAGVGEAERHAARKVGTSPEWVNVVALQRWDRTLSQERDRRLDERHPEATKEQLASLRGHVTRELLTELEHELRAVSGPGDAQGSAQ